MNTTFKTGLILGACGIIAILSGYFAITTMATVAADHAVLGQIVQLINANSKQAAPAPAAK